MEKRQLTVLLVEDDLNDIFLVIKPMDYRAMEHLFESITHYWGLECAKTQLEVA